jgi:hypothetical protein
MFLEAPIQRRAPALLGRVALRAAVLAIPAWIAAYYVVSLDSQSSGAPFMFAMFFLPACIFSMVAVLGGYLAAFLMRQSDQQRSRSEALIGARIGLATVLMIPLIIIVRSVMR